MVDNKGSLLILLLMMLSEQSQSAEVRNGGRRLLIGGTLKRIPNGRASPIFIQPKGEKGIVSQKFVAPPQPINKIHRTRTVARPRAVALWQNAIYPVPTKITIVFKGEPKRIPNVNVVRAHIVETSPVVTRVIAQNSREPEFTEIVRTPEFPYRHDSQEFMKVTTLSAVALPYSSLNGDTRTGQAYDFNFNTPQLSIGPPPPLPYYYYQQQHPFFGGIEHGSPNGFHLHPFAS